MYWNIKLTILKCTVCGVLSYSQGVCSHPHGLIPEPSHTPGRKLAARLQSLPVSFALQRLATAKSAFCLCGCLPALDSLYKQNLTLCGLLWLASSL